MRKARKEEKGQSIGYCRQGMRRLSQGKRKKEKGKTGDEELKRKVNMARLAYSWNGMASHAEFLSDLNSLRVAPATADIVDALDGLEMRVHEAKKLVRQTESKVEELGNSIKQIEQDEAEKHK